MEISDRIRARLKSEYDAGKTYQAMAKNRGVSYEYMRALITGRVLPENMQLNMLFRLFPHARIDLEPGAGSVSGTATAGSGTAIVGHHIQTGTRDLDSVLDKVMASELDPAAKVAVYSIIRAVRERNEITPPPENPAPPRPDAHDLTCPKCKKKTPAPDGADVLYCVNCGQKIRIKD